MANETRPTDRLVPIEGLRGYLALWVVLCHVLWFSGWEIGMLPWYLDWLLQGSWAVNGFVVVSGFVIVLLIDTKQEAYGPYIVRRFFRLFPVFIILFACSITLVWLSTWNLSQSQAFLSPQQITDRLAKIGSWWEYSSLSIPAHLVMLHGMVPEIVAPHVPGAFLTPAWSISLEWQFYLLAPLLYACAVSRSMAVRIGLWLSIALLIIGARRLFPTVEFGAFLPFHAKWFALGALLYWAYKHYGQNLSMPFVPLTHPFIRAIGKRSYSIYLSHALVLVGVQTFLLSNWPELLRHQHMVWLLLGTLSGTGLVSMALYRYVEVPGIEMGRIWAARCTEGPSGMVNQAISLPAVKP